VLTDGTNLSERRAKAKVKNLTGVLQGHMKTTKWLTLKNDGGKLRYDIMFQNRCTAALADLLLWRELLRKGVNDAYLN
jgi:hypothetical protein